MNFIKKILYPFTATISFIQNHFKAMVFLLILFLIFAPSEEGNLHPNNLQKISLVGPIMDATEIVKQINEVADNDAIKGVLFDVNSPGGAVAPSIEIAYAIKRLQEKKPVVAYASGTMASGSYYASIWATNIIANPGSMVGSIGVIMQGANVQELMQKIGIKTQVVSAGKYKQVGTSDREWTKEEKAELNKVIQGTYDLFTNDVANARDLDIKKRDTYANAHIFTALQAKEVGLIDEVGVEYDAKEKLIALSNVTNPVWNKEDKFEKFMKQLGAESVSLVHIYFPEIAMY